MENQITETEFDINNPNLAAEGEGVPGFDPNADSNAPPRPPKSGTYLVQFDFTEADPEKRFVYGSKSEPDKDQVRFQVSGKIVGCEDTAYEEKHWLNRTIGGKIGVMVGSWAVRGQKGTSHIGDFLKAYGLKAKELVGLAGAGGQKRWRDTPVEELVTECIISGQAIRVFLDWEFTGGTKELINPETGKGYWLQYDYKDPQLDKIPQGMRNAKDDGKGGKEHQVSFHFVNDEGEEDVQLFAQLKVERFMPPKRA